MASFISFRLPERSVEMQSGEMQVRAAGRSNGLEESRAKRSLILVQKGGLNAIVVKRRSCHVTWSSLDGLLHDFGPRMTCLADLRSDFLDCSASSSWSAGFTQELVVDFTQLRLQKGGGLVERQPSSMFKTLQLLTY